MPLFTPRLPIENGLAVKDYIKWSNLHGSAQSLALLNASRLHNGSLIVVTQDSANSLRLEREILSFSNQNDPRVHLFPDWQTLPYDAFSPHQDIVSKRLETIYLLQKNAPGIFLVPINTLMQRLAPKNYIGQHLLKLQKGDIIDVVEFRRSLENFGYLHVSQVVNHSEFSIRGAIIDLFPMGSERPFRIDLFDDEIDSIQIFDPSNQRSLDKINGITLLPAHEFPTDKDGIRGFKERFLKRFPTTNNGDQESILYQTSKGSLPGGIEYYLPLFFEQTATLFDYLHKNSILVLYDEVQEHAEKHWQDIQNRHEQYKGNLARPLLAPEEVFINVYEVFSLLKNFLRIGITTKQGSSNKGFDDFQTTIVDDIAIDTLSKSPYQKIQALVTEAASKHSSILFIAESSGHKEALQTILQKAAIHPQPLQLNQINDIYSNSKLDAQIFLSIGQLEDSVFVKGGETKLLIITEKQLLGSRIQRRRASKKSARVDESAIIRNLAELSEGSPVVHIEHGVGRFIGLQTLETGGVTTEFLTIEYAKNAKLYVPVSSLHLISRYSGGEAEHAPLHHLGNDTWSKAKKKAAEKVRDVAAQLLDLYAKRAAKPGFAYPLEWADYLQFKNSFPYPETEDQETAINAVVNDMGSKSSMDRLVCGDVGFGKTEVAMRAAYVAASCGKQVAILVPTTLLAQQHYDNFKDRFSQFAFDIKVVSRFITQKEQKQVLEKLAVGKVDIIVGTHRLLQKDVKFADLGLVIIDEEHRFGVRQKETFKSLRANVDVLTLTATPIPRTLNMAMSGMRDLSIIATPPAKRLSIKTFVIQRNEEIIREAIMREILRGGQVYFLHNEVKTIEKTAQEIAEIVPEARIAVGHGQMRERELETVMNDFYHQRYSVLVCSTIIETGIDIPTANTIIMDRADHLGLAQMHQLRGRVGRSHHQAYAYLLTPHPKRMTKDATKRLDAIASLEGLGAGFALATHDLEIRGAGELLGDEQSGQINAVGFALYMEMLDKAVKALKDGKEPSLTDTLEEQVEVELRLPALFPETYIPDVHLRLSMYKKLANCANVDDVDEFQIELIDRFGLLPEPTKNLIKVSTIKIAAGKLGIRKLEFNQKSGSIEFDSDTKVSPGYIISLIQQNPLMYKFEGPQKLRIIKSTENNSTRIEFIENLLIEMSRESNEARLAS